MILSQLTRARIMRTMTNDLQVILAETSCELIELAKELVEIIRNRDYSIPNRKQIIKEFADVLVMLVATQINLDIHESEIMNEIIKVCEEHENTTVF